MCFNGCVLFLHCKVLHCFELLLILVHWFVSCCAWLCIVDELFCVRLCICAVHGCVWFCMVLYDVATILCIFCMIVNDAYGVV